MTNRKHHLLLVTCLIVFSMLMTACAALAQSGPPGQSAQPEQSGESRPVYLDVRPVASSGDDPSLSGRVIEDMARSKLSELGHPSIVMNGQTPPSDVYVLRIMYVVHRQSNKGELTVAASASTQLLRKDDRDNDGVDQTYSLYSGLQQTLVQSNQEQDLIKRVRDGFERQFEARISAAFLSQSFF